MAIGKTEFLKRAAKALVGLIDNPLNLVSTNNNYYVNKQFGIILEKPDTWGFVSVNEYGRLFDEQIIDEEWLDKEEVGEVLGEPAFLITKYWPDSPENEGKFSPTIGAFITHRSELDFEFDSFEELIELSGEGTAAILKDFREYEIEGPIQISGRKAYIRHSSYLFEHVKLNQDVLTRLTVLIIEHNDYYYYINMHDSDEVGENAHPEFQTFMKSIVLI
ncbi:hypothetical protein [Dyadobacter sp. OTU695]|uniref:hypothetical protein n=1 Tax=Dyadobacter sp. OTU695 TaxID=3043860 RepID=UPI00313B8A75